VYYSGNDGFDASFVAKNLTGKDYYIGLTQMLEDPPVVTDEIKAAV